jgi:hypothetical protein
MNVEEVYFTIVSWGNPYRAGYDRSWMGAYTDRKTAQKAGKRLAKRGPNAFKDWCGDSVKVSKGVTNFRKAANKLDMNPNLSMVTVKDEDGNIIDEIENNV